jgi:hypothetical protein
LYLWRRRHTAQRVAHLAKGCKLDKNFAAGGTAPAALLFVQQR